MKKILILLLLFSIAVPMTTAQEETTPTATRLQVFGRGTPQTIQWHPEDDILLVSTVIGTWLYDNHLREIAHIDNVRLATFNPQGTLIAGVDQNNQIVLWDSKTYEEVTTLDQHMAYVMAIAWSPDGKLLASTDDEGVLIISDTEQEQPSITWEMASTGSVLKWSPDGQRLAGSAPCNSVVVARLGSEYPIRLPYTTYCTSQSDNSGASFAWVDESTLAINNGRQILWDLRENTQTMSDANDFLPPLSMTDQNGNQIEISTQGNRIVVATATPFSPLYLYTLADNSIWTDEMTFEGNPNGTTLLRWNASDTLIATLGRWGDIRLWDSSDGKLIVANSDFTQTIPYDPSQYDLTFSNTEIAGLPAWSSGSELLAIPDNVHTVAIWNAESGELVSTLSEHQERVMYMRWNPINQLVATTTGALYHAGESSIIRVWNGETGQLIDEFESITPAIAWRPDGSILVVAGETNIMNVWDPETQSFGTPLRLGSSSFSNNSIVPDGIWWSQSGNTFTVVHQESGRPTYVIFGYPSLDQIALFSSFSNTNQYIGAVSRNGQWLKVAQYCTGSTSSCNDPFVIETSTYDLGIPFDGKIGFSTLRDHQDYIDGIAWSPDTQYLASFSADGEGRIWDVIEATTLFIMYSTDQLIWSPDGHLIASHNTWQNQWEIYSVPDGQLRYTIPEFSRNESFIVWSPDSQRIAQVHDGIVEVWELD